ncbi:SHOCT domain-containing protein [Dactylosporangium cerinum]|uniref:SHOCT domain-containing protein n=1 Tax=Dactylosporangium cerinum TaxID=1434730 RepID=A0ABV9W5V1_9ACTN
MSARVVIAKVIGLAAAAAVGVGTYGGVNSTDCEPTGTCHISSDMSMIAVTVGLPVAVIAILAGGGLLVTGAIFAAVGAGALAAGVAGDNLFGWVFGGIFVLVGVGIFAFAVYMRRVPPRPNAANEAYVRSLLERPYNTLVGPGRPAVGTVLSVTDTGTTLNDSPLANMPLRVELADGSVQFEAVATHRLANLRLRVEPADGSAPFEAVATKLVSPLAAPQPGDRFSVDYDPADWTRLAIREAPPVEPRQNSMVDQLARLDELRRSGALTQPEFDSAKARLLRHGDSV